MQPRPCWISTPPLPLFPQSSALTALLCPVLPYLALPCQCTITTCCFAVPVSPCCHPEALAAGQQASTAYLWAQLSLDTQQIAADAGTCSLVQSQSQLFLNHFASIAGGAMYGTDLDSLQITCSDGTPATAGAACATWVNNTVQAETVTAANGAITQLQVWHHYSKALVLG